MSEEKKEHPAKVMGRILRANSKYSRKDVLADMLEVNIGDIVNVFDGIQSGFTDDKLFIFPYLLNIRNPDLADYEAAHAQLKDWPKLTLADIFNELDFLIEVRSKGDWYRKIDLTEAQKRQIGRIIIGKKRNEDQTSIIDERMELRGTVQPTS